MAGNTFMRDAGSCTEGPAYRKYKATSDTQAYIDREFADVPRKVLDRKEEFDGPLTVRTIDIPIFDSAGTAKEFATTGSSVGSVMVDFAGFLLSAQLIAEDALAAHDSNYLTFTLVNNGNSNAATVAMLAATDANTTKATGGVAITAEIGRSLTVNGTAANLRVANGDLLTFDGTATGTLANAVDAPVVRLRFATLPTTVVARTTKTVGTIAAQPVEDTAGGEALLQLSSTNEVNVVGLDYGDQLCIPATKKPVFMCRLKLSGVAAATRAVWGLASAYNATFDDVASNIWFRIEGNNASLLIESDDATTDDNDNDTGIDLTASTYYWFIIDCYDLSAIRFFLGTNDGDLELLQTARLSASALTASSLLQPCVWLQKDSGTGEQSVTVDYLRVFWER